MTASPENLTPVVLYKAEQPDKIPLIIAPLGALTLQKEGPVLRSGKPLDISRSQLLDWPESATTKAIRRGRVMTIWAGEESTILSQIEIDALSDRSLGLDSQSHAEKRNVGISMKQLIHRNLRHFGVKDSARAFMRATALGYDLGLAVDPQGAAVLSNRDRQILSLLAFDLDYRGIADALEIRLPTVREHIQRLYSKLRAHSKDQALRRAIENGLFVRLDTFKPNTVYQARTPNKVPLIIAPLESLWFDRQGRPNPHLFTTDPSQVLQYPQILDWAPQAKLQDNNTTVMGVWAAATPRRPADDLDLRLLADMSHDYSVRHSARKNNVTRTTHNNKMRDVRENLDSTESANTLLKAITLYGEQMDITRTTKETPVLTEREHRMLCLLAQGVGYDGLAKILGITLKTSMGYLTELNRKLGTTGKNAAMRRAVQLGLFVIVNQPPSSP